jgi:hypothetical protein
MGMVKASPNRHRKPIMGSACSAVRGNLHEWLRPLPVVGFLYLMTNDILEQVVADYFTEQGYFTQHNISYRPNNAGVHSDIDVLAVHPLKNKNDVERVAVISCKSGQAGINIKEALSALGEHPGKVIRGAPMEKRYREIADPVWATALREKVFQLTGEKTFTFYLAATSFKGKRSEWEQFEMFTTNLPGCGIQLIDIGEMVARLWGSITITPSHSELGRLLQLIKASGLSLNT